MKQSRRGLLFGGQSRMLMLVIVQAFFAVLIHGLAILNHQEAAVILKNQDNVEAVASIPAPGVADSVIDGIEIDTNGGILAVASNNEEHESEQQQTEIKINRYDDYNEPTFLKSPLRSYGGSKSHDTEISSLTRNATLKPDPRYLKVGENGAISSDLELCNRMAVHDILLGIPGTNAADAAVTLALCIGMINFFNSGIGGGGYLVFSDGGDPSESIAIDFREMAPELSDRDMFVRNPSSSKVGGLSVGVPGELAGLYRLFEERGSGAATWEDLLQPVIDLGYGGWSIGPALGAALKEYESYFKQNNKEWHFVMHPRENRVLTSGEWISRPALAKTLEILAKNGTVEPFYDPNSDMVQSMVSRIQSAQGIITESDFSTYYADVTKPLKLKIREGWEYLPNSDLTVLTTSGSSSGAALLSALKIMDNFDNTENGDYQAEEVYQLIEAMKWMASARSRLGDFGGGDMLPDHIQDILDDDWAEYAVSMINAGCSGDGRFATLVDWKEYLPEYEPNDPQGTMHFSIVDHYNNAVSLTSTVNLVFGSLVHDPNTGVIFNNQMDDFSQPGRSNTYGLSPSVYNYPGPYKRPLSSSAPTIVLNELGLPDFVVGAAGGSRITTAILQTLVRTYWYDMPLLDTIAYPRVHHQLLPQLLEAESFKLLGTETTTDLRSMGHKLIEVKPRSVVNAVKSRHGMWHAVSDYWRKRGISVVY